MEENKINYQEFIDAQIKYANERKLPLFMPKNGRCYHCKNQIFDHPTPRKSAAVTLITGCPFCNHSYCD